MLNTVRLRKAGAVNADSDRRLSLDEACRHYKQISSGSDDGLDAMSLRQCAKRLPAPNAAYVRIQRPQHDVAAVQGHHPLRTHRSQALVAVANRLSLEETRFAALAKRKRKRFEPPWVSTTHNESCTFRPNANDALP